LTGKDPIGGFVGNQVHRKIRGDHSEKRKTRFLSGLKILWGRRGGGTNTARATQQAEDQTKGKNSVRVKRKRNGGGKRLCR